MSIYSYNRFTASAPNLPPFHCCPGPQHLSSPQCTTTTVLRAVYDSVGLAVHPPNHQWLRTSTSWYLTSSTTIDIPYMEGHHTHRDKGIHWDNHPDGIGSAFRYQRILVNTRYTKLSFLQKCVSSRSVSSNVLDAACWRSTQYNETEQNPAISWHADPSFPATPHSIPRTLHRWGHDCLSWSSGISPVRTWETAALGNQGICSIWESYWIHV